jgi:hypothetical protein
MRSRRSARAAQHRQSFSHRTRQLLALFQPQGHSNFLRLQLACGEAMQHMKVLGG